MSVPAERCFGGANGFWLCPCSRGAPAGGAWTSADERGSPGMVPWGRASGAPAAAGSAGAASGGGGSGGLPNETGGVWGTPTGFPNETPFPIETGGVWGTPTGFPISAGGFASWRETPQLPQKAAVSSVEIAPHLPQVIILLGERAAR